MRRPERCFSLQETDDIDRLGLMHSRVARLSEIRAVLRLAARGSYALSSFGPSDSGSLAMFAAIRRASSQVSSLAAARLPGSSSK